MAGMRRRTILREVITGSGATVRAGTFYFSSDATNCASPSFASSKRPFEKHLENEPNIAPAQGKAVGEKAAGTIRSSEQA